MTTAAVKWVCVGMGGFMLEKVVLSHNRKKLIECVGEGNYHTAYSVLSTATLSACVYGLYKGRGGPYRRVPRMPAFLLGTCVQALGIAGLSQTLPRFQP